MSQSSISAAKKRRGVAQLTPPVPPPRFGAPPQQPQMTPQMQQQMQQQQMQQQRGQPLQNTPQPVPQTTGLTLPQVIALIDTRLVKLEKFMNESTTNSPLPNGVPSTIPEGEYVTTDELSENMSEFDNRFQLLATEFANIKDIVLSLQRYTMDVNRMLLESQSILPESDDAAIVGESTIQDSTQGANVQFVMSGNE
jgi:hypothetical protein